MSIMLTVIGGDESGPGEYGDDDCDDDDDIDDEEDDDDDWDEVEDGKENGEGECRWWLCCLRR